MRNFPSKEVVERLRKMYPEGARIQLVSMNDPYTKLIPGDLGTVEFVDAIGTIHVSWDCGSCLGVAYGEDVIRKIQEHIYLPKPARLWAGYSKNNYKISLYFT